MQSTKHTALWRIKKDYGSNIYFIASTEYRRVHLKSSWHLIIRSVDKGTFLLILTDVNFTVQLYDFSFIASNTASVPRYAPFTTNMLFPEYRL